MANSTASESRDDAETVLSAVANDHRRAVLRSLQRLDGGEMGLESLTRAVADRLQTDPAQRRQIRVALHHNHLPKLDAAGLVVYSTERNAVRDTSGELGTKLLDTVGPYDTTRN